MIVIHFNAFNRINWKIDSIGSVEINNNHERANFDVNENLPSSLLINGFFGMKFFYGSSALRASDPPKNFIPQKPFISNLEGKFPFTSKGSLVINIFLLMDCNLSQIGEYHLQRIVCVPIALLGMIRTLSFWELYLLVSKTVASSPLYDVLLSFCSSLEL